MKLCSKPVKSFSGFTWWNLQDLPVWEAAHFSYNDNFLSGCTCGISYTYNNAGNVTTITDALAGPQTQEFSYNDADMVIQASAAGGTDGLYSENYSYSSGNLYNKGGVTNTYGDTAHPHAVTARSNGNTYVYDDNGNQTQRVVNGQTYNLTYDAESRLVEVKKNSTVIATFVYDGDGKQVKGIVNGVTTYYVGAYYQKQGTLVTKYYYAGAERVAMRQGGVLYYIFGDHLGSTAVVKNTQGGKTELRYTAWGTTRYEYGSTPTDRRFTGQREEASLGLYFYNARWYDPAIGRFIQADTIVPGAGNPQAWDRYTDPSGKIECDSEDNTFDCMQIMEKDYIALLNRIYHWIMKGNNWRIHDLLTIVDVGWDISAAIGGSGNIPKLFGEVEFEKTIMDQAGMGNAHHVWLSILGFSKWTVAHELAHGWDAIYGGKLSKGLESFTGGYTNPIKALSLSCTDSTLPGCNKAGYFYGGIPPKGSDSNFNRSEDYAEAFTAYVYPLEAKTYIEEHFNIIKRYLQYDDYRSTTRGMWMDALIYLFTYQ